MGSHVSHNCLCLRVCVAHTRVLTWWFNSSCFREGTKGPTNSRPQCQRYFCYDHLEWQKIVIWWSYTALIQYGRKAEWKCYHYCWCHWWTRMWGGWHLCIQIPSSWCCTWVTHAIVRIDIMISITVKRAYNMFREQVSDTIIKWLLDLTRCWVGTSGPLLHEVIVAELFATRKRDCYNGYICCQPWGQ